MKAAATRCCLPKLSPEEIAAAFPNVTQTIEIEAILDADEIPFVAMEQPQEPRGLDRCRLPAQRPRHHHQRLDRPGMGMSVPVAWDEPGQGHQRRALDRAIRRPQAAHRQWPVAGV